MTMSKPLLFLIDDDEAITKALERLFHDEFVVRSFADPQEALRTLTVEDPAILLTDYMMPSMSGLEFLKRAKHLRPTSVRVILSGRIEPQELTSALQQGLIHRFFVKPWENSVLKLQVAECLQQRKTLVEKESLLSLALTEPVTGLGNYRLFQEQMRIEMDRARRHVRPLSLVMLDIDHFKKWNDELGHPAGDQALKDIAQLLLKGVRSIDWVTRYGGDEFALILPDTPQNFAVEIAERIRKSVESSNMGKGPVALSLSAGIASFPEQGDTNQDLIQAADQALYAAKRQGRNQTKIAPSL